MPQRHVLVAGSGNLVGQIIAAARARGLELMVFSVVGDRQFDGIPVRVFDPADLAGLFGAIRDAKADRMLLAGYVAAETWNALQAYPPLGIDPTRRAGTAELARRLAANLPAITGAELIGINDLAPELMAPDGTIAGPSATARQREQALVALRAAREQGWTDLGQAVVMYPDGSIEAEDAAGTDALLLRIAGGVAPPRASLVLAKALKPNQPLVMDVPVIGPATIENARRAGVSLIALEAGGTVIVDRDVVAGLADEARICIIGMAF